MKRRKDVETILTPRPDVTGSKAATIVRAMSEKGGALASDVRCTRPASPSNVQNHVSSEPRCNAPPRPPPPFCRGAERR